MASVRGMTPEAILALIKRELANVKLSEGQIRDLIQTNTDLVGSIVDLEDQVKAGLTGEALDQLKLELQQLKTELQTQGEALATADKNLQENAQTLIDNAVAMALLSALLSDEGFLNTEKIKPGTIIGEHLAAQTVTALNIASGAIVSEKIAADAITANHILAESITGDRLVARTVGADRLVADSISSNEISSGAITTNELAAGAVTATNISAEGISADLITAGSLSATRVELDGNDLSTQMQFILGEMDRKHYLVERQVKDLGNSIYNSEGLPVFSDVYGDLTIPENTVMPQFIKWLDLSMDMRNNYGFLIKLALRGHLIPVRNVWAIQFTRAFEGRMRTYSGGQLRREYVQDPSRNFYPAVELDGIDRMVWYAESQTPVIIAWVQKYNMGGARIRVPANDYSYIDPHKVNTRSGASTGSIRSYIRRDVSPTAPIQRSRGTAEGRSSLETRWSTGLKEEYEYPTDLTSINHRFPSRFDTQLDLAVSSIQITGTMRIRQPRRMDSYGLAIYKNDELLDYVAEGGVGTLTGASPLFSHEEISLSTRIETPFLAGDRLLLLPIGLIHTPGPFADAHIMEWDISVVTYR